MESKAQVVTYQEKFKKIYYDLNVQWIEKYFCVEKKDLEQLTDPEGCIADGGEIFFVLVDGKAVGTCAMYNLGDQRYELAKMAVHPDFQGRGFSNLLMENTEEWAKAQGGKVLVIRSNTKLTPAITLYKKYGYQTVPSGNDTDYERCNIEMHKKI